MNQRIVSVILVIIVFSVLLYSCQLDDTEVEKEDYEITNINIYKNTPVWELALAVRDQKTKTIEKIAKDKPELLNYQDPKYDATLLLWAVGMEKYNSVEALLRLGADPNIASIIRHGETPLFIAAGFSWIGREAKKDPKYVNLLLEYGADPNINYIGSDIPGSKTVIEPGTSPLMNSIGCGIEKTKALVEAGADINYKTKTGTTAAIKALGTGKNAILEELEYAHYLIVEKKAKITDPYFRRETYGNDDPNEEFFSVSILRNWVYDLGSDRHKVKMEIVEEFVQQGVNYWDAEINKFTLEQIKKLYPDTWQEYTKKY
ncbi:ankyrin repeat domain-containing protein [Alkaliphilus crotonatoxidans]